jgi:hypothetical protein
MRCNRLCSRLCIVQHSPASYEAHHTATKLAAEILIIHRCGLQHIPHHVEHCSIAPCQKPRLSPPLCSNASLHSITCSISHGYTISWCSMPALRTAAACGVCTTHALQGAGLAATHYVLQHSFMSRATPLRFTLRCATPPCITHATQHSAITADRCSLQPIPRNRCTQLCRDRLLNKMPS